MMASQQMETNFEDESSENEDVQESQLDLRLRRTKLFKRQNRVHPEEKEIRKQSSDPTSIATTISSPTLQKHESYPQYSTVKSRRVKTERFGRPFVGSLIIHTVVDRQPSTSVSVPTTSQSINVSLPVTPSTATAPDSNAQTTRASHTPAVRSGPPLSCNFCWNTVDDCGRILRRKTQYHCPECRTNLCIVPCFHEYHDATDPEAANAR